MATDHKGNPVHAGRRTRDDAAAHWTSPEINMLKLRAISQDVSPYAGIMHETDGVIADNERMLGSHAVSIAINASSAKRRNSRNNQ